MQRNAALTNAGESKPRIRGLVVDAAALGIHRTTLWRAIHGEGSPKVLARYQELLRLRNKSKSPSPP